MEAVNRVFRMWPVPVQDEAEVVLHYLGSQAKQTVKLMTERYQANILKVNETLQRMGAVTVGGMLKDFCERIQQFKKKIRAYGFNFEERTQRNATQLYSVNMDMFCVYTCIYQT